MLLVIRRAQVVLSVVFVALLGVATNVATSVLPASWRGHLWVAWPLLLVLLIAAAILEVVQKDERPADLPSAQARAVLIQRVRQFWVKGVLEKSLYNEARIELDLVVHESADRPWDVAVTWSNGEEERLAPGTGMAEVFARMGRRTIILGEPGAGKTTMLLELARSLLDEAEDKDAPVPVVLPLASWARQRRTIAEWIVDELVESYNMPRMLASEWRRTQQIIPLFDGLDEVAARYRQECVAKLNDYLSENPTSSVICCRRAEYGQLRKPVRLHGILTIEPLTIEQTQRFLADAGPGLNGLRAALATDPELWTLASSPLLLSIMALAYRDGPELTAAKLSNPRRRLYSQYLRTMLRWRTNRVYAPDASLRYLCFLARQLRSGQQTMFTLDLLNAGWLPEGSFLRGFNYTKVLAGAPSLLVMFIFSWPLVGMAAAIIASIVLGVVIIMRFLNDNYDDIASISWRSERNLRLDSILRTPTRRGDITSNSVMKSFLMAGLGFLSHGVNEKIAAFVVSIGFAVILSVLESALSGAVYAIPLLLCYTLVSGMIDGFLEELSTSSRIVSGSREIPSPTLRPRVHLAIRVGLAWALITGFITAYIARLAPIVSLPPNRYGLVIGAATFLATFVAIGGGPILEQRVLRYNLNRLDLVPWPCLPFLDFMSDCLILRKVGHGYIFVHRELLDFLADMTEPAPSVIGERQMEK